MTNIRWKRWGGGAAGAVVVYAAAGFWLVPAVVKSQLPKYAQTELERQASIADVSFNPFTLRFEAHDFKLSEASGAPLFAVGGLVAELDWRSLFKRAWSLAEVRISAPAVNLSIAADGTFNIAQFLDTLNRKPHEESSGMPRLVIRRFVLEQGHVEIQDKHAGYSDTITPIDLALNNLSTLPDDNGDHTLSADEVHGGKLRWKGTASLSPIAGSGELTLENVALPGVAAYLKPFTRVRFASGALSAKLPYRFAYKDGKLDAGLNGAGLALHDVALHAGDSKDAFLKLKLAELSGVGVDLAKESVSVEALKFADGTLGMRRDAHGEIDLANLGAQRAATVAAAAPAPAPAKKDAAPKADSRWKLQFKQVALDRVALGYVDEMASPAMKVSAADGLLHGKLDMAQTKEGFKLSVADAEFALTNVALASGAQTPVRLSKIGFDGGALELLEHRASLQRLYADGGQFDIVRDAKGAFAILNALPKSAAKPAETAPAKAEAPGKPWEASVKSVELNKFGARYDDASTGIKANIDDLNLKLANAGSDLKQPVKFDGGLKVREGGQLAVQGKLVPQGGALEMDLQLNKLAIKPVQPLLSKYLKLKIADGAINAKGHLGTGKGVDKDPALRYEGSFEVASLALNEEDNDPFATWKTVGADKLRLNVSPNRLDIAELRVVEPDAKLIIENDRSFNAARLLVQQPEKATAVASVPVPAAKAAQPADEGFPVRVRRVRFQNAKLDFTDLSLRPQFSAKMYELNGVITGLSTKRDARSQIELDGRVDEYGSARVRGQLNPFVPADNTDLSVIFKNVDMVSASPYSMKFAGYKIAEGKISLDLQYKVRDSKLEGNNHIVLDKLTLGERIDSPDALHLPLELALAILKDSDGRIDLGLPVAGDLRDPEFSYGAVVWKAVGNILTKVVTSPFRALGSLFGISGEKLESIEFDPGSASLAPPEREKLNHVAKILTSKPELKLAVPAQYSADADGAALRTVSLRRTVATRAGVRVDAGEQPGPLDIGERKIRSAMRDLYAERFGKDALEQQKKAAEAAAGAAGAAAPAPGADHAGKAGGKADATGKLSVLQRLGNLVTGEPQVADLSGFYRKLQDKLETSEPLPADALQRLGQQRAAAILAGLKDAGANPASARAGDAEAVSAEAGQPVALKLGLSAK